MKLVHSIVGAKGDFMKNTGASFIILIIVVVAIILAFNYSSQNTTSETQATTTNQTVAGTSAGETTTAPTSEQKSYFDNASKVMYFWSPACSWCQKESVELENLAKEGYRVKNMNVQADSSLWEKYSVTGTPTFIAEDGSRLEGYNQADTLRPWLEAHGGKIK